MTDSERLKWLKEIEKDIYVCSLESTFADDAKSCAIHSAIEELEQKINVIKELERIKIEFLIKCRDYYRFDNAVILEGFIETINNRIFEIKRENEE